MKRVAVLCAMKGSVYHQMEGVEVYDDERNALSFGGGMPVVAHPPCRLFGRLSWMSRAADPDAEIALGIWTASQVRRWGGILEHPRHSRLWEMAGLPKPGQATRAENGWTLAVPQYWFGHRAPKETWLYIQGVRSFDLPRTEFRLLAPDWVEVENMCKREREATPLALAEWLVAVARVAVVRSIERVEDP